MSNTIAKRMAPKMITSFNNDKLTIPTTPSYCSPNTPKSKSSTWFVNGKAKTTPCISAPRLNF
jgi:hypothetical protein